MLPEVCSGSFTIFICSDDYVQDEAKISRARHKRTGQKTLLPFSGMTMKTILRPQLAMMLLSRL